MDYSEKWGRDVDEAVQLALNDLKVSIDEVDVTVLEEPSRGFFGIGSKLAKVRVEIKKKEEEKPEPPVQAEPVVTEPVKTKTEAPRKKEKNQNRQDRAPKAKKEKKSPVPREAVKSEPVSRKEPEEDLQVVEDHAALTFLRDVVKEMGLDVQVSANMGKEALYLEISGKDSGTIIGKRGQTLDAIQYLVSLVVNKDQSKYTRVVVDAENYRAKRERTLEALAFRLANKVSRSKRSVKLEPMNPYERKVIHAALQNHPHVTTRSEGEDPYRRVIIELK